MATQLYPRPHDHPTTYPEDTIFGESDSKKTTQLYPPPHLPSVGNPEDTDVEELHQPSYRHSSKVAMQTSMNDAHEHLRQLSNSEWAQFCRGIGVLKDEEKQTVYRPTSSLWPPKGFPDGLYRDTLFQKTKFTYWFHMLSAARWIMMLLQLAMSAILTALGSLSLKEGTPITVIAAINTAIAGLLALLHNSGLPDRYRSDRNEFNRVELHIKEIVDTRMVPTDESIAEVMAHCFKMYSNARQTVQNNVPASYTAATSMTSSAPAPKTSKSQTK